MNSSPPIQPTSCRRRRRAIRRDPGAAGYTLLELMVTMSLVGIVLLAAGQIIGGAGRLLLANDQQWRIRN